MDIDVPPILLLPYPLTFQPFHDSQSFFPTLFGVVHQGEPMWALGV